MSVRHGLDYDHIADQYDRRYQQRSYQGVREKLSAVRALASGRGLEVGCGTGHWLPLLEGEGSTSAIGLDRSIEMLRRGREAEGGLQLVHGDAGQIPFASGSVGLTATINALHHFPEPVQFLREAARVLTHGGHLLLIGLDAHDPDAAWYIYEYFDGTRERDRERYPRWDELHDSIRGTGMQISEGGLAHQIRQEFLGAEVFEDPFLARTGTSQLGLLSERAYRQGRQRIRAAVEQAEEEGRRLKFRVRLDLVYLLARKERAA